MSRRLGIALLLAAGCSGGPSTRLGTGPSTPAPPDPLVRKLRLPAGFRAEVFACEPQLANPVAFAFDERGRAYVSETFRAWSSVYDVRNYMSWLDDDLACRRVEDRAAMCRKHLGKEADKLAGESERVRLLEDADGDGRADRAVTFAEGFSTMLDGIASGVLARGKEVWFANIPSLWHLRDEDGDGVADARKALHTGYGVRFNYIGHDLHGLVLGPDGKLYFSIGDRGLHVETAGRTVSYPDAGAVLRCNPDGSDLELYAVGMRNPQELAFDQHGNLFTWDNNSDWHDMARWVYVVEGGDCGWRVGYQHLPGRGAWEDEHVWQKGADVPYRLPPVANIDHGPSGIAFYPGTGLPARYDNHFFACNFPGGVNAWTVRPKGASFEVAGRQEFLWNLWGTDVAFGAGPGIYVSDWGEGWNRKAVGRIFRVFDPALERDPAALEVKKLLAEGMGIRAEAELSRLLAHRDQRVRQEAQFELAARRATGALGAAARSGPPLARLHAIWGLGQVGATDPLLPLLKDGDAEVRAQAAKVLGERRQAYDDLLALLSDPSPRVRFFAAAGLGKHRRNGAVGAVVEMLRENADGDAYLRHAGVMALAGIGDVEALAAVARDPSKAVRLAALLALRRLDRPEVKSFLEDPQPGLVLEAARAINDVPIPDAMPALAAILNRPGVPERALLRALNSSDRLGDARALVEFARRPEAPEALRAEALKALAEWERPPGRDRVVGLWRPLAPRDPAPAREALERAAGEIAATASHPVLLEAIRALASLKPPSAGRLLEELLGAAQKASVRVEALKGLARLDGLGKVIGRALADPHETVRVEAIRLLPGAKLPDAATRLEKLAAQDGPLRLRQAAVAALGALKEGETILSGLVDRMPELPAGLRLDVVEAALKRGVIADPDLHLEGALLDGGDVLAGRGVLLRPEAGCIKCHKVNDGGGTVGPNLTLVGSRLPREKLLQSILDPNAEISQGYDQVIVRTSSGDVKNGRVEREDDRVLVLMDAEGRLEEIPRTQVEARARGKSAMPEDLSKQLSKRDLRDLVAYLAALKGVDPKTQPLEPGAVVADNEDPSGFKVEGNWRRLTLGGDHGQNADWSFPDPSGRGKATWTVSLPRAGRYGVYVWTGADPLGTHAADAPFTVEYDGGRQTVRVDQTRDACSWKPLGAFPFRAGRAATVTLSNDAGANVYADAVKFVPE